MATEPGESNGHPENSWETKGDNPGENSWETKGDNPGENSDEHAASAGLEQELEDPLAQATIDLALIHL